MQTIGFGPYLSEELLAADQRRRAWIAEAALDRLVRDSRRDTRFAATDVSRQPPSKGRLTALATIRSELAGLLGRAGERLGGGRPADRATA